MKRFHGSSFPQPFQEPSIDRLKGMPEQVWQALNNNFSRSDNYLELRGLLFLDIIYCHLPTLILNKRIS